MNRSCFFTVLFFLLLSCGESELNFEANKDYKPVVDDITDIEGINDTYGKIIDQNGEPVQNVVVTDGYTCVMTDEKGIYQFKRNKEARFVYYSNPSGYEIATVRNDHKMALFYAKLSPLLKGRVRNDFVLTRSSSDQKEFTLLAIGDPQVANSSDVARFRDETIQDIRQTIQEINTPLLGLSMGDVVADQSGLLEQMKTLLGSTEMPVFTTIGNHDKFVATSDGIKIGEMFSNTFGPLNYSFNYGDVHFICIDNVIFTDDTNYDIGVTTEQINWITKDLSFVPKTKMVILYYHMPMRGTNFTNRAALLDLFKDYESVHFMCGHTHYTENYIHTTPQRIYEHVHGAACGAWWKSTINGDGTPNGYAVYTINGTNITNWFYKAVNYDKDFQIRLHRGNASFGGEYAYFGYGLGSDVIIANVWNADPSWQIEVYEDNVKTGNMTLSTITQDAWSKGYHIGVLNRNPSNYSTRTTHLYRYTLQNSNASVRVVAKDSFGNVYEQTNIITDFLSAISYQ